MLFITWPITPEIGELFGITFRWYGILFALGLFFGGWVVYNFFKKNGYTQNQYESLLIYLFLGIFLGARLAHCIFYEPSYYLAHPLELLLPITELPDGSFEFSGYHGLASHGGGVGLIIALWLYCRKYKVNFWPLSDYLSIATPLAGGFIQLGNLANSEIVGAQTDVPWAFIFPLYDQCPRHPAQLYEALFYFALFGVMFLLHKFSKRHLPDGFFLAFVLLAIGAFRFCIEFVKEIQVSFEQTMTLNMGQWLSIPFVVVGIGLLFYLFRREHKNS